MELHKGNRFLKIEYILFSQIEKIFPPKIHIILVHLLCLIANRLQINSWIEDSTLQVTNYM